MSGDITGREFDRARLCRLRKSRRLTIAALARAAGMERATLSNIERGITKQPHDDTVGNLAKVLEVDPHDLWLDTNGSDPPMRR